MRSMHFRKRLTFRSGGGAGRQRASHHRQRAGLSDAGAGGAEEEDLEEALGPSAPPRRLRREALHSMEPARSSSSREEDLLAQEVFNRRSTRNKYVKSRETDPERLAVFKILDRQRHALDKKEREEREKLVTYAKRQILESYSTEDLVQKAETLIEDDWMGHIEEMPGNMFSVGAFGSLLRKLGTCNLKGIKAQARLLGCVTVSLIQLVGPPAVFFTTVLGIQEQDKYDFGKITWANKFADWEQIFLTKFLGVLFLSTFVLNGLFVILEERQTWFKIYSTFQYLRRNTPNFEVRGSSFLYFGAFVNCWTVLWCCISSFVVVGGSASPSDLLLDALGMLFLYNLDDIGGELGFVDGDDWAGLRLAWIYEEMVKRDWHPLDTAVDEEAAEITVEEVQLCTRGCGRPAKGYDPVRRKNFNTCCRACGTEGIHCHDESCSGERRDSKTQEEEESALQEVDLTRFYTRGGWAVFFLFQFTASILGVLSWAAPLCAIFTPFTIIVPNFGD